jgi:copper chaperone CopZ
MELTSYIYTFQSNGMLAGRIATKPYVEREKEELSFMASTLLFKADKMKQRLQKSFSCSSSASTSVVAFSSGRLTAPPSSTMASSSTKLKKKKKTAASPASSSRFLLNSSRLQLEQQDVTTFDSLPPSVVDFFPSSSDDYQQIAEESSRLHRRQQQAAITRRRSCSTATSRSQEHHQYQVVVLKVSLHCKGCAGKVKKHISKMEGVTSFDIDMATKKVTVMGDVTPLGVLNCISKVKSAQFWPSSPPRSSASF